MDGFLNILKPPGMTSHDVVQRIRELVPAAKIGHGGTLDPAAAGVLPLLLGKATRLSFYLLEFTKVYRAELKLGITTETQDLSGKITGKKEVPDFTIQDIEQVFQLFKGEIQQIPPMYSAVKQKGKKLYQYAREGKKVEREPRKVFIHSIKLLEFYPPSRILFEVKCSKGTYIRTLCVQIGDFLECGGHMSFLLRKQVGLFSLQEAHTMEQLLDSPSRNKIKEFLLPLDYIFQGSEKLFLHEAEVHDLQQGRYLAYTKLLEKYGEDIPEPVDETVVPVYTKKSVFTLLARWKKEEESMFYLKPEKVLQSS